MPKKEKKKKCTKYCARTLSVNSNYILTVNIFINIVIFDIHIFL
jgi:hypothetical protein